MMVSSSSMPANIHLTLTWTPIPLILILFLLIFPPHGVLGEQFSKYLKVKKKTPFE